VTPPAVELASLTRSYPGPPPVTALRPCDLTIHTGDYLAVTGPSGAGKSTLLNLLGLLDRPTGGQLRLGGQDVGTIREGARNAIRGQLIGFVFQLFHLLNHRSVRENVEMAMLYHRQVPRRERLARAGDALARVGLASHQDASPATLSGGERQRVAVARAIASRPLLLLADEPTGNLDSANAGTVLDLFDELHAGGLTIVVVTHNPEVADRAGRWVEIRDGLLREGAR
jgi:putative ABC transport system ATP-binding protein